MLPNLKNSIIPDRISMTMNLENLLEDAKDNAYQLSMPLLIAAQLGHQEFYQRALLRIENTLSKTEPSSFKAWLLGRKLLAADSIDDKAKANETLIELKQLLQNLNASDEFIAWSLGYLASINHHDEYNNAKEKMIAAAEQLTQVYWETNKDSVPEEKKQAARSNALWAWVMGLQAGANAHDKELYDDVLKQMCAMMQQEFISEALFKGLLRTSLSNDYPAWAIAIVRLASATIGDEKHYLELEEPLKRSIAAAKEANAASELLLAKVNDYLAIDCHKLHQQAFTATSSFKMTL